MLIALLHCFLMATTFRLLNFSKHNNFVTNFSFFGVTLSLNTKSMLSGLLSGWRARSSIIWGDKNKGFIFHPFVVDLIMNGWNRHPFTPTQWRTSSSYLQYMASGIFIPPDLFSHRQKKLLRLFKALTSPLSTL
jgi:hypothetical protein